MALTRKQIRAFFVLGIVVGAFATGAIGAFLSNSVPIQNGVTFHASSGPAVNITESTDVNMTNMFPASDTVEINSSAGNITINGSNFANVTIDNINGTWTNTSSVDVVGKTLTLNPDDKSEVTLGGDITAFEWRQAMATDDGTPDFTYSSSVGSGSITLNGVPTNTELGAIDADSGAVLDIATSDGSGSVTFSSPDSGSHVALLATGNAPSVDNSSASPDGGVSMATPTLSINVSDPDFDPGDEVTVEWYVDGNLEDSDMITSNQTVDHTTNELAGGDHTWHVEVTDAYGNTATSSTFDVNVPTNITIRNVTEPHDIVQNANVEILITGSNETVDRQTVTDGNISLVGLDITEEYIVLVNASGYHRRSIIVEDMFEQDDVFVLNETEPAVATALQVDDPTGQFQPGETQLIIQKVINRSLYDSTEPEKYQWTTVAGDRLGADQEFVVLLEEDGRYRIIVTNTDGDRRVLGEYSATAAQTVILSIEEIELVIDEETPYTWNATQENVSGTETIKFRYNDSQDATSDLRLVIHERGNASNEIENTTHPGPFGVFTHDQQLSASQKNKTWVVEWQATRNGETITGKTVVGLDQDPLVPELDDWLKNLIAIGSIIIVGFAAGGVRMEAGAVLVALLAAMWWYVGFMPAEVSGGMIALAMAVSMSIYARGGRRF